MKIQSEAGFLIAKIHQISGRIFNRFLKDTDIEINTAQGRIMFVLWKEDGIPIRELGRRTALEKSTLTSMLDRLEESGYIKRVPAGDDRRKILIWRTAKDIAMEKKYVEISKKMNDLTFAGFSEAEVKRLENYLRRVLDNLVYHEKKHK